MSTYRRVYLPNHSYFFTVVTAYRERIFPKEENVNLLKAAIRYTQSRKPFRIDAICILPDHLHCLWTMREDCNHSVRWQMIKTSFTRRFRQQNPELKQSNVWQPRYYDHVIRNQDDWTKHIDYIHYNPVKHELAESTKDWRYSSFRKFLEQGYYEKNWGDCEPETVVGMRYE